jgi:hypothetical protein
MSWTLINAYVYPFNELCMGLILYSLHRFLTFLVGYTFIFLATQIDKEEQRELWSREKKLNGGKKKRSWRKDERKERKKIEKEQKRDKKQEKETDFVSGL